MSCSHNNGTASSRICLPSSSAGSSTSCAVDRDHPAPEEASPPEVLGSVVHCHEPENGDKNCYKQLRTSARVSKKLRLDSLANQAPPEKKETPVPKEDEKPDIKPKQRRPWELWPLEDKNTFFEALNEYGKDFDAIQKYFEAKAKKKNQPDTMVKNKEQIRHFYYRTWHKISKHLMFPEEVKKGTQELYGLINFGELRKKIGGVSEKTSLKLNELIYRGFTKIRVRGKTIRIKTPICRALRKLNQQEEFDEELKLPTHVAIQLRPRSNEAWARVQSVAQNPRLNTLLPLQRRLSTLIAFLEEKWQSRAMKYCASLKMQLDAVNADISSLESDDQSKGDAEVQGKSTVKPEIKPEPFVLPQPKMVLRVAPSSHVAVAPLTVNLSDYFTSSRLSLNSHEERLGNHGAEEMFKMVLSSSKGCNRRGTKRQRHDSFSDKKQQAPPQHPQQATLSPTEAGAPPNEKPEYFPIGSSSFKKENEDANFNSPFRLFGSEVNLDVRNGIVTPSSSGNGEAKSPPTTPKNGTTGEEAQIPGEMESSEKKAGPSRKNGLTRMADDEKSKSTEEVVNTIRAGWTCISCNALTIGELYLMFGSDSKIMLEYWWEEEPPIGEASTSTNDSNPESSKQPSKVSLALQKLVSIAKLHSFDKNSLSPCPCGHLCNCLAKTSAISKTKAPKTIRIKTDTESQPRVDCTLEGVVINKSTGIPASLQHDGPFRRPLIPSVQFRQVPNTGEVEAFKAQLEKFRPRYCNRRGRPASSRKNVVVPRILPLLPKAPSNPPLVAVQVLPQSGGEFISSNIINVPPKGKVPIQRVVRKPDPAVALPTAVTISATAVASTVNAVVAQPTAVVTLEAAAAQLPTEVQPGLAQEGQVPDNSVTKCDLPETDRATTRVQDVFPSVISDITGTRVSSPPSISNLLDMSLSSELGLSSANGLLDNTNFSGLLNSDTVQTSSTPTSPSRILKEDDNQWLNSDLCDFSLSSFLGQLESPAKRDTNSVAETTITHDSRGITVIPTDVEGQMQCLMAENSLDYINKFADLAAQMASDGGNKT